MTSILNSSAHNALNISTNISKTLSGINEQLSTGKRVNSALDDPTDYYTSLSLNDKGTKLDSIIKDIKQSQTLISGSSKSVDSIIDGLKTGRSQLRQAISSEDSAARGTLAKDYNNQLDFVTRLAADNDYNGTNILAGDDYTTYFNELRTSSQSISGIDISTIQALGLDESGLSTSSTVNLFTDGANSVAVSSTDTLLTDIEDSTGAALFADGNEIKVTNLDGNEVSILTVDAETTLGDFLSAVQSGEEVDYSFDSTSGSLTIFGEKLGGAQHSFTGDSAFDTAAQAAFVDGTDDAIAHSSAAAERRITALDAKVKSLETFQATLGSNNRNLNTRLEFSESGSSTNKLGSTLLVEANKEQLATEATFLSVLQQFSINGISTVARQEQIALNLLG